MRRIKTVTELLFALGSSLPAVRTLYVYNDIQSYKAPCFDSVVLILRALVNSKFSRRENCEARTRNLVFFFLFLEMFLLPLHARSTHTKYYLMIRNFRERIFIFLSSIISF